MNSIEITNESSIREDTNLSPNGRNSDPSTPAPHKPDKLSVREEQSDYASFISEKPSETNFNTVTHAGLKSKKDHSQTDGLASNITEPESVRPQSQSRTPSSSVTSVRETRPEITHSEEPEDVTGKTLLPIEKPSALVVTSVDVEQKPNLPPVKYRAVAVEEFTGNLQYPYFGELKYFPVGAEILEVVSLALSQN